MPRPDGGAILARIGDRVGERGLAATVRKAIGDHVFRRSDSVMVEYRRGWRGAPSHSPLAGGFSLRIVRRGDTLPPLCDWMAWRHADFAAMLAGEQIGIFLLDDETAIGCAWCTFTDYRDAETREHYRVGPREAYHYCWMLDPLERRGNAGIALLRGAMVELDRLGIDRQFGIVDCTNRASYLVQYRFGYRECGQMVTHYYVFGTRWTRMRRYTGTLGPVPASARATG